MTLTLSKLMALCVAVCCCAWPVPGFAQFRTGLRPTSVTGGDPAVPSELGWSQPVERIAPAVRAPHWPASDSWPTNDLGFAHSDPTHTINLDQYVGSQGQGIIHEEDVWQWQLLPHGLIYRPYLAGRKQSRLAGYVVRAEGDSTLWEGTMGAQIGVLRYGNQDPFYPEGYQLDVEAAADIRLDIPKKVDVRSVDFRVGTPFTFGYGRHRTKFGYYHLSSHLGDEFLLDNPGFNRLNFSRDVLILGHSYFLDDRTRMYAELGWAFVSKVSEPWELQFGIDHTPYLPTGLRGEPFYAIHGHLREELNFGGYLSIQAGWAWVGERSGNRLRMGLFYLGGESSQYSFYDEHEQLIGVGVWYDQ